MYERLEYRGEDGNTKARIKSISAVYSPMTIIESQLEKVVFIMNIMSEDMRRPQPEHKQQRSAYHWENQGVSIRRDLFIEDWKEDDQDWDDKQKYYQNRIIISRID